MKTIQHQCRYGQAYTRVQSTHFCSRLQCCICNKLCKMLVQPGNCMHLWHTDSNCSHIDKQWPSWCWVVQAGHCMPQARTCHSWFPIRNFQYSHLADHLGQQHSISSPGGGLIVHAVPDSHLLVGGSWAWWPCLFSWYIYCTGGHALP